MRRLKQIDKLTSDAGYNFMDNIHITEMMPAESMNKKISEWYSEPPFKKFSKVGVFEADGNMEFYRVYKMTGKESEIAGQFVALERDIKGLTPQQLKDKFDLPQVPTHMSKVTPPKGTKLATGIVEEGNFGGKGMGTQFYFTAEAKREWFSYLGEIKGD